jgi:hypothetical protein
MQLDHKFMEPSITVEKRGMERKEEEKINDFIINIILYMVERYVLKNST